MDLKLPITIIDELSEHEIRSQGELDLASGEIRKVSYDKPEEVAKGAPASRPDYESTSGILSNGTREVEFRIEADAASGAYSVTPSELLELKGRAARLFTKPPSKLH